MFGLVSSLPMGPPGSVGAGLALADSVSWESLGLYGHHPVSRSVGGCLAACGVAPVGCPLGLAWSTFVVDRPTVPEVGGGDTLFRCGAWLQRVCVGGCGAPVLHGGEPQPLLSRVLSDSACCAAFTHATPGQRKRYKK